VPRVFAGCCVPLLEVDLSRCYLLNLYIGAWTRTPPHFPGALARFFPENIGLTLVKRGSARWNAHHNSNFHDGHHFRGCSHSFMFRLPYLLDLQVAPTSTASAIGQPGRLHHAMNVWLPYTNRGIATYPNRAIDMAGLSPARLRPFRPLPKTPVVACTLAITHTSLLPSDTLQRVGFHPLFRDLSFRTTIIHFSGLNTEPATSLHPASDSRHRFCPWTSLMSCWLNFTHVGLPQILSLSAGASPAMRFNA